MNRRVVLIVPPYNMSRIMSARQEDPFSIPHNLQVYPFLGVQYIAAVLNQNRYEPFILDCTAERMSIEDVASRVKDLSPLLVGVYVNSFMLHSSYLIIQRIKRILNVPVVVGGPHITTLPDAVKELGADYGIIGEGEYGLLEIARYLSGEIDNLPDNIITRETTSFDGFTPSIIEDIDRLPFPFRSTRNRKIYYSPFYRGPVTTMIASRGCPFRCIFCASPLLGRYRLRDENSVVEEMSTLVRSGYRVIQFQDDAININRKWLYRFCDLIVQRGLNKQVVWDCNVRIDLLDLEDLNILKAAGCEMIRFGVESGSNYIRNEILKKGMEDEKISIIAREARRRGIKTLGYFMLGLPEETESRIDETKEFIRGLNLDYIDVSISVILPGTRLEKMAVERGILDPSIWKRLITQPLDMPCFYQMNGLNDLRSYQRKLLTNFYANPHYILHQVVDSISENRLMTSVRSALLLFRDYLRY